VGGVGQGQSKKKKRARDPEGRKEGRMKQKQNEKQKKRRRRGNLGAGGCLLGSFRWEGARGEFGMEGGSPRWPCGCLG
jgi:hypothetical protein